MTPPEPDHPHGAPGPDAAPREVIGLGEAVALIIGVVIGAGIFKAPSLVASMTGEAGWMFAAWALGGLMSFAGALCYAEPGTAYAHVGGDYHQQKGGAARGRGRGRGTAALSGQGRIDAGEVARHP